MRLLLFAALAFSLNLGPAAAHPHSELSSFEECGDVGVECAPARDYTAGDWVLSTLAGDLGLAIGGGGGFALGFALAGSCHDDPDDSSFLGPCFMHGGGGGLIVGTLLGSTGLAAGVYLYGEGRGHRGSYWAALGGGALGTAAAAGIMALSADNDAEPIGWIAAVTLPALASTLGYYLSRDTSPRPIGTSGALLDLGTDGEVRLGVPNITLTGRDDNPTVGVTLFGGAL